MKYDICDATPITNLVLTFPTFAQRSHHAQHPRLWSPVHRRQARLSCPVRGL